MKLWLFISIGLLLCNSFIFVKSLRKDLRDTNNENNSIIDLSEVKSNSLAKFSNISKLLKYSKDLFKKFTPQNNYNNDYDKFNVFGKENYSVHHPIKERVTKIPAKVLQDIKPIKYLKNIKPELSEHKTEKINRKNILKIKHNRQKKYKQQVIYIDDYYPLKYVKLFFENLMSKFQIKSNVDKRIQNIKTYLMCKNHIDSPRLKFISKENFTQLEITIRLQIASRNDYVAFLKDIMISLKEIARELERTCKGPMEYIKLINDQLYFKTQRVNNIKKILSNHYQNYLNSTKDNIINHLAYSLKVHNFEESGKLLGLLINSILS
jgi:hypothetical protein